MALAKVKVQSSGGKGQDRWSRRADVKAGARKARRGQDAATAAGEELDGDDNDLDFGWRLAVAS